MENNINKKQTTNSSEWKDVTEIRRAKAKKVVVRKISKVLALITLLGLIAKGAEAAYDYGYNSDFAQHFWDNTKTRLEEMRKEREALKPKILENTTIDEELEK